MPSRHSIYKVSTISTLIIYERNMSRSKTFRRDCPKGDRRVRNVLINVINVLLQSQPLFEAAVESSLVLCDGGHRMALRIDVFWYTSRD